ncbi:MAG: C39 family peptidase [Calothrix sp. MO_192.B10]|nr:C39 family peptidase [Calothrix sp. MO_192.B10]
MREIKIKLQAYPFAFLATTLLIGTGNPASLASDPIAGCSGPSSTTSIGTNSSTAKFLTSVPAYNWYNGCGPTAAASVLGYWDLLGYSNIFDAAGDDVYLTPQVQDQISSPEHNAKYNPTPDNPNLPTPTFTSIADWFRTSVDPLNFGWSYLSFADDAFKGYANFRGYDFDAQNKRFSNQSSESLFNWDDLVSEIDSNRPLMFLVDTDGNGGTDHFVPVMGYDDRGAEGRFYGLYTTWSEDETIVWKPFQDLGNSWGVGYATFVRPLGSPQSVPEPSLELGLLFFGTVGVVPIIKRKLKSKFRFN